MIADEILEFTFSGDSPEPIKRHLTRLASFLNIKEEELERF